MRTTRLIVIALACAAVTGCATFDETQTSEPPTASNERMVTAGASAPPSPPSAPAPAPQPEAKPAAAQRPTFETRKVDGTDNVYIFRYLNRQAMFIVTRAGVIATDPIGYGYPETGQTYVNEIRKITKQPIKYLIYSHHHLDHISGGKAFKDAGATFVAHKRVKDRLSIIKDPATVMPDETFSKVKTIRLGGTTVKLQYLGLNHSDSSVFAFLPKEKLVFAVDVMPVGSLPVAGMRDSYPLEWERTLRELLKMDWQRLIPGHPGAPNGRLGTKEDVKSLLAFFHEASEQAKTAARAGRCYEPAVKEFRMPKYEKWPGYENSMPLVATRYCSFWGRGT